MSAPRLRVLALEPWHGGSHALFLEEWRKRSDHDVEVVGLPARHWKWRMNAGAWGLARRLEGAARPDVVLASDYVDLPALRGFLPAAWGRVPSALYFHENQLTYPLRPGEVALERDLGYAFKNILSCLSADAIAFNSGYHLATFRDAADALLSKLPKPNPRAALGGALAGARVIGPGVDFEAIALGAGAEPGAPLRVLFNHRWEHDKDPAAFLRAVREATRRGAALELVLLGETFEVSEPEVAALAEELAPSVRQRGFVSERADYLAWLAKCDLVVSTARHEFFGIAVVEALAAGCSALLPDRLAYPGLLPGDLHGECLYASDEELTGRLLEAALQVQRARDPEHRARMRAAVKPLAAEHTAEALDALCLEMAESAGSDPTLTEKSGS